MLETASSSAAYELLLLGIAFVALSGFSLLRRVRANRILCLSGGLDVFILLFAGTGLAAYAAVMPTERVAGIPETMQVCGWPLLIGYGLAVVTDVAVRRHVQDSTPRDCQEGSLSAGCVLVFIGLSYVGYLGSLLEAASAGAGTIFPVLKMFWYPAILAGVLTAKKRGSSLLILALTLAVPIAFSITSVWRSELVAIACAVLLGLYLRFPRGRYAFPALAVLFVLLVLPFANLKKLEYARVQEDRLSAFSETLAMPIGERLTSIGDLWAIRINAVREIGFVVAALESRRIESRAGESYLDAARQLIPRVLWPDKPSFNTRVNYSLSRQIGLLEWNDPDTSWGLNMYAEVAWNFGADHLVWAVPLSFGIAALIDRSIRRRIRHVGAAWFVNSALFFFGIWFGGVVNALTFLLWTWVVGWLGSMVLRATSATRMAEPAHETKA